MPDSFSLSGDFDDDEDDLELEPPDAEVVESAKLRAASEIRDLENRIDVDALYEEADRPLDYTELLTRWKPSDFRFRIKHLMYATAAVAVIMTLLVRFGRGTTFVLGSLILVAGLITYFAWEERRRERQLTEKRRRLYERNRQPTAANNPPQAAVHELDDLAWQETSERQPWRPKFSLKVLLQVSVAWAVLFALIGTLTLPTTSTLLGFIALGGLLIHTFGYEPSPTAIFIWWGTLVLYILLSIFSALWQALAG